MTKVPPEARQKPTHANRPQGVHMDEPRLSGAPMKRARRFASATSTCRSAPPDVTRSLKRPRGAVPAARSAPSGSSPLMRQGPSSSPSNFVRRDASPRLGRVHMFARAFFRRDQLLAPAYRSADRGLDGGAGKAALRWADATASARRESPSRRITPTRMARQDRRARALLGAVARDARERASKYGGWARVALALAARAPRRAIGSRWRVGREREVRIAASLDVGCDVHQRGEGVPCCVDGRERARPGRPQKVLASATGSKSRAALPPRQAVRWAEAVARITYPSQSFIPTIFLQPATIAPVPRAQREPGPGRSRAADLC